MGVERVNKEANGGTELLIDEFKRYVDKDLYNYFHIVPSRLRDMDDSKIGIYWAHDLPGDPECDHLKSGGYNRYEKLVFVSNWQMQRFIDYYGIPWRKCVVIQNGIEPVERLERLDNDPIKLIYHTTPHRGLEIVAPVFNMLCERYDNIELDVYSSFSLYGNKERDKMYEGVFEELRVNERCRVHGAVSYDEVCRAVGGSDIFIYPSIWMETSCRCLMESMSAGLVCVHPNYGALSETAANWTLMYQYQENKRDHARVLLGYMCTAIESCRSEEMQMRLSSQRTYASVFYNWNYVKQSWENLLKSILHTKGIKC
jgi:glycosyltransferase involved in cell wall biosynthesis